MQKTYPVLSIRTRKGCQINTDNVGANTMQMPGNLSSNSPLCLESSQANTRACISAPQRTVVQICCNSKVFTGTFPYEWSRSNLRRTIHLNTAACSPCTVTFQMTAEPPKPKLAFYCHWIIICSSESCTHTKCAVSKERRRRGEPECMCVCVCVCVCVWGGWRSLMCGSN